MFELISGFIISAENATLHKYVVQSGRHTYIFNWLFFFFFTNLCGGGVCLSVCGGWRALAGVGSPHVAPRLELRASCSTPRLVLLPEPSPSLSPSPLDIYLIRNQKFCFNPRPKFIE